MRLCALTSLWLGLTLLTIDAWAKYLNPPKRRRQVELEDLEELDTLVGSRSDNGHTPVEAPVGPWYPGPDRGAWVP